MSKKPSKTIQNTLQNKLASVSGSESRLRSWMEAYFQYEVTTMESSQRIQRRDLELFLNYLVRESGDDRHTHWIPRLSQNFKTALQHEITETGQRRRNDRTVNRILAHVRTFAKWVHFHKPFPLGQPMAKVKAIRTAHLLDIERALTAKERNQILNQADLLTTLGGRSKDRHRFPDAKKRPRRKSYRPWRNRAIVYTLIETGMRRAAITRADLDGVDMKRRRIATIEKGGFECEYRISREGLQAIRDYLKHERDLDAQTFDYSSALFMPAGTVAQSSGRLHPKTINDIWKQVCEAAGVSGKTPHSARHAMGNHIIEKTGNAALVQKQLNHLSPASSLQYTRSTGEELDHLLDERE